MAHFDGKKVESRLFGERHLEFKERSQIWSVSSGKVKRMLENIASEVPSPPPFSPLGCDAALSKARHNCITWSRTKLKLLDIHLPKSPFLGFFVTLAMFYTKKPEYYVDKPVDQKQL